MTTSRGDQNSSPSVVPEDVPDWGSAGEPATGQPGLPGNPGFLTPWVPAFAVRDHRGRAIVETPLSPPAQARYLARSVVAAGALTASVAGTAVTLLAGHLLGAGALPDGRPAPAWLVIALAVVALAACVFLLGARTVALAATGSARVASRLTWATALLAVALGVGTVVGLDLGGIDHPLARDLEPQPLVASAVVTTLGLVGGLLAVLATASARREARALQERLRALRRDGVRTPGRLESVRYRGEWTDDGRPRLDATVSYRTAGTERRVDLLLVAPQDRVPLPGAPVVVVHDLHDADADGRDHWLDDVVLVELDQSRPLTYDPDVAAYAKEESADPA